MIPVTQTKMVVKNAAGLTVQNGNCWAAAIASILELPLSEVPNLEVWFGHDINGKTVYDDFIWVKLTQRFLIRMGYTISFDNRFKVFHLSLEEWETQECPSWQMRYKELGDYNELRIQLQDEYYFVSGLSARGVSHVTIWKADKMVHDPHPSRDGILEKSHFEHIRPLTDEEKINAADYNNNWMVPFPSINKKQCS